LLEYLQSQILPQQWTSQNYYKFFIFLNKKTVTAWLLGSTKQSREAYFQELSQSFQKERSIVNKRLSL
jgi:hypothetical protein